MLAGAVHQAAAGSDAAGVVRAGSADVRMNCFSADTKVYTRKGEKTMKELEVGEYVSLLLRKYMKAINRTIINKSAFVPKAFSPWRI